MYNICLSRKFKTTCIKTGFITELNAIKYQRITRNTHRRFILFILNNQARHVGREKVHSMSHD